MITFAWVIRQPSMKPLLATVVTAVVSVGCYAQPQPDAATAALQAKGFDAQWIDQLMQRGEPRWYTGDELQYIGQPVGGQYAGQLYMSGGGRLWYWDIFNQQVIDPGGNGDKFYNRPMRPKDYRQVSSGFVLELDDRVALLDGRGFENTRFRGEYPIARVQLEDEGLPVEVELEAFSPLSPTDTRLSSMPATIMSYTLTNTSDQSVSFRVGGWLENAGNRRAVKSGALTRRTSLLEGVTGVLLSAETTEGADSDRPDITVENFEDGYGAWVAEGDAFGDKPFAHAKRAGWQLIQGTQGKRLINTHNTRLADNPPAADALTGTLTSPVFEVRRKFLSFVVAGGSHRGVKAAQGGFDGATVIQVLVGDEIVAAVTGDNSNQHRAVHVDLGKYQRRDARVRIVDSHVGGWGHIQADNFVLTDTPQRGHKDAADSGTLALALLGVEGELLSSEALPAGWRKGLAAVQDAVPQGAGVIRSNMIHLAANESVEVRFAIAWHFANGHAGSLFPGEITRRNEQRNYYSMFYGDAGDVIHELTENHNQLAAATRLWRDTWYDSTLPVWFLDRTFVNTSTLATTAAFRMHDPDRQDLDGRVYFWEGVYRGPGTCTHVTHYEQAFGRLFPDAARAQRQITDFNAGWRDQLGYVGYRGEANNGHHFGIPHAIDGHAGTILRTYREHTTSVDDTFLRSVWPRVKRAVQFMIDQDAGRGFFADKVPAHARNQQPDGILEGPQYNTLDKVWDGVIPWISGLYMASLRASTEMARDMGDDAFADQCARIVNAGGPKLAEMTFNKEYGYFVQHPNRQDRYVNSNDGCHLDQVFGDSWAGQLGLSQILPQAQRRSALNKIFEHNLYRHVGDYRKDAVIQCARFYADADEPGLIFCTFPNGGARQSSPTGGNNWDSLVVGYFTECWTAPDYLVAAQMFDEQMPTHALAVARAVHDRYAEAPLRRNPFNEVEYGNHYTRAMSSYAAYIAATGFEYHGPKGRLGFAPRLTPENFKAAFTVAEGWGSFQQQYVDQQLHAAVEIKYGALRLNQLALALSDQLAGRRVKAVRIDGADHQNYDQQGDRVVIRFDWPQQLNANNSLAIELILRAPK